MQHVYGMFFSNHFILVRVAVNALWTLSTMEEYTRSHVLAIQHSQFPYLNVFARWDESKKTLEETHMENKWNWVTQNRQKNELTMEPCQVSILPSEPLRHRKPYLCYQISLKHHDSIDLGRDIVGFLNSLLPVKVKQF